MRKVGLLILLPFTLNFVHFPTERLLALLVLFRSRPEGTRLCHPCGARVACAPRTIFVPLCRTPSKSKIKSRGLLIFEAEDEFVGFGVAEAAADDQGHVFRVGAEALEHLFLFM